MSGVQNSNKDTTTILCLPKPTRGVLHYKLPARLELLLDMPRASKETQVRHSWNTEDRSHRQQVEQTWTFRQ